MRICIEIYKICKDIFFALLFFGKIMARQNGPTFKLIFEDVVTELLFRSLILCCNVF
jgi:hypothetical protein